MGSFARPDLFISTEEVARRHGDPHLRVVDCRFRFDGDGHADYLEGHLPGAAYCDWTRDIAAPPPPSGHPLWMLPGPREFADAMARMGIGNDTFVVGYDAEGGHQAARLWLALRRYGHDRFAVMEGGIQKWLAERRPLEQGEVTPPRAEFVPHPRGDVIASKDDVLAAVKTGDPWLLDVRRETEFTGQEKRAARAGHIPGAVNILWQVALGPDWMLRDPDEIESLYSDAGFGPDTATITYCQGGVRAAFTHLVLHALGHDDVRTYDGSWEEWGNDPSLPVIAGRS